jgi:ribosome biogenesis protein MAK21
MASEALEELWIHTFLPRTRKLLSLSQRPLYLYEQSTNGQPKKALSPRILLLWRFEEMVKDKYNMYLRQYIARTLQDSMEVHKVAALRTGAALMRTAPEGETILLPLLVNKIGDPSRKVVSIAAHEMRKLLKFHRAMQPIVAREVQQLAHRPQLSSRALYNSITFLNQLVLHKQDNIQGESLASSLIKTYFRLFEVAIKPSTENGLQSRLLSALLTGVNRAHLVHQAPPAAATQALLLLFHVSVGSHNDGAGNVKVRVDESAGAKGRRDRFYRALYAVLSRPNVLEAGKHMTMFYNLLYKAMKHDKEDVRVVAFAKRLLCTTMHSGSSTIAATLFLLDEIGKHHAVVRTSCLEMLSDDEISRRLDVQKREPLGAVVDKAGNAVTSGPCPLWEIASCKFHYHPAVQKLASTFGKIDYMGDPLKDFSLAPFLDKFAYRNPKSSEKVAAKLKRNESIAERRSGTVSHIQNMFALPVNDPSNLNRKYFKAEEEFFHNFFVEQARRDKSKGVVRHKSEREKIESSANADWDTDSDEEAFVDSLAEKLLSEKHGPVDVDDDFSFDGDNEFDEAGGSDGGDSFDDDDNGNDDDEDGGEFGDEDYGDDDDDEDEDAEHVKHKMRFRNSEDGIEDGFMDDSDSDGDGGELGVDFADFDGMDAFADGGEDEEEDNDDLDEEEDDENAKRGGKRGKKGEKQPLFASAEDYEEMIAQSMMDVKRPTAPDTERNVKSHKSRPWPGAAEGSRQKKRHKR